ncbi:hypothetical protein SLEP1_g40722 [Rubroshorea leprosula]|uniref:F-box domain-containing protein n=1 Tax=Rubroshorea leprosula TaxID=152421 RepID=A0AAV5L4D4_9ROSI|nr:hypothetical protein SLEP1_g40722 [Rubroshorea leprosula]
MSSLRQWERLPEDLLPLIFQRFDQLSRTRSSAVCKSWTSALKFAADHDASGCIFRVNRLPNI